MSFLHGWFGLNLFSSKPAPDTWNTLIHPLPELSCVCVKGDGCFWQMYRIKGVLYPVTLGESVVQIKEVVRLTVVSVLPQNKS